MKLNTNIIRSDSNGEEGFQAIMNLDKDGVVSNINYIYKTLAAWAPRELTGNHFSVIFDEQERRNNAPEILLTEAKTKGYSGGWYSIIIVEGILSYSNLLLTPFFNDGSEIIGFTVIVSISLPLNISIIPEPGNLEALINNIRDVMWSVDRDYKLTAANKAFTVLIFQLTGAVLSLGDDLVSFSGKNENVLNFKTCYDRALAGATFSVTEYVELPAERWSEISFTPIVQGGIVTGIACTSHDITGRKLAEEKLRYSESRMLQAQEIAQLGSWERNFSTGIALWSEGHCRIYGLQPEDKIQTYETWLSFIHPDDLEWVKQNNETARAELKNTNFYHRIIRKDDGAVRYIHAQAFHEYNNEGKPVGLYGVSHDITDQRVAEEKVRNSEHRFRSLIEHSMNGLIIFSADRKPVYISSAVSDILGYSIEEMEQSDPRDMIHPDYLTKADDLFKNLLLNPGMPITDLSCRRKHKDGTYRWLDITGINLLHDSAVNGIVYNFRDVTEKKLAEENMKRNDLILQRAQEVGNFGSYEVDFITRTGIWSDQFCNIFGISAVDNIHSFESWLRFIHPDDRARVTRIIDESDAMGKNVNFHYRIIRGDGKLRHIYSYRQIEFDNADKPSGAFVVAHDITEEITSITQLKTQTRQLNEIAWMQSHKIRRPLANILGLCQLLNAEDSGGEIPELVKYIQESAESLDEVIREIVDRTYNPEYTRYNPFSEE